MEPARVVLRLTDVVKTFPGVVALKGVSFEVLAGEVHALVGENGAGKSTLMSVAAGSIAPDSGTVEIGGRRLEDASPAAAQALGLAVVYQHLSILEDLTVAENMVFAMPPARRPPMRRATSWVREQVAVVGATIDPAARVSELGLADRQLLEIAKALALEPAVLVLDEPTESLTPAESERLLERVREIARAGTAVVYISHRLPEVQRIADRLTVMRDGETRGTLRAADASEAEILRLIIGRATDKVFPPKVGAPAGSEPLLRVAGLSGPASTMSTSRCARARSSASPASTATASASSCGRSPVSCTHAAMSRWAASECGSATPRAAVRPASCTCPAIATPRVCCCR